MSAYSGIRIVDFSAGVAGPMAAMLLGDFGAEVVKVEPPEGDRLRSEPGYLAFNRNKQVLTLDLESSEGMACARSLVAGADVALFDFAPSRMSALDLTARALRANNPALVHAWMPPYGTHGTWSELPPSHGLLAALTGNAFHQGAFSDVPVHLVLPVLWHAQAVLGATAIGAALFERRSTGWGQAVEVTGLHGAAEANMYARMGNGKHFPRYRPGQNPRYRLYRCADGEWLFLGALFVGFYRRALAVMGIADELDALEADTVAAEARLQDIFLTRPRAEWLELLRGTDVPCSTIQRREEWFGGDVVAAAGLHLAFEDGKLGHVAMPAPPVSLSVTPAAVRHLPQTLALPPRWEPAEVGNSAPRNSLPLAGVRVLNLGAVVAGAYTGAILASLGADVVKVEPHEGDGWRSDSAGFLGINRGTRGLCLDLKRPEAQALFVTLARNVDVVIDNFRPGVRARLGIDYAALKAANPAIISCSITGYGDVAERAGHPAFDPLLQAEGGMMAAQGGADEPVVQTLSVNDIAAAATAVMGVVAALHVRSGRGEGQEVMTSLLAQSLLFQLGEMVTYVGRSPAPLGGKDCLGVRALERHYVCADGWIAIDCTTAEQAGALCTHLQVEPGTAPLSAPRDGRLAQLIECAAAGKSRKTLLAELQALKVPACPAIRPEEIWEDPWLNENRFTESWLHPRLGEVLSTAGYFTFPDKPLAVKRHAPDLGEHSAVILGEWGVPRDEIERLIESGIVEGSTAPETAFPASAS